MTNYSDLRQISRLPIDHPKRLVKASNRKADRRVFRVIGFDPLLYKATLVNVKHGQIIVVQSSFIQSIH